MYRWKERVTQGLMVPLHKKGNIYLLGLGGLLSTCSRELARVTAKRLSLWNKNLKLLGEIKLASGKEVLSECGADDGTNVPDLWIANRR